MDRCRGRYGPRVGQPHPQAGQYRGGTWSEAAGETWSQRSESDTGGVCAPGLTSARHHHSGSGGHHSPGSGGRIAVRCSIRSSIESSSPSLIVRGSRRRPSVDDLLIDKVDM